MQKFLLVKPEMRPIPGTMKILGDFGSEQIIVELGSQMHTVRGDSMLIEGSPSDFIQWLGPLDGFWTTKNPMLGDWHVQHVKQELVDVSAWLRKFNVSMEDDSFVTNFSPEVQSQFSDFHRKELARRYQATFKGVKMDHDSLDKAITLTYQYLLELYLAGEITF